MLAGHGASVLRDPDRRLGASVASEGVGEEGGGGGERCDAWRCAAIMGRAVKFQVSGEQVVTELGGNTFPLRCVVGENWQGGWRTKAGVELAAREPGATYVKQSPPLKLSARRRSLLGTTAAAPPRKASGSGRWLT